MSWLVAHKINMIAVHIMQLHSIFNLEWERAPKDEAFVGDALGFLHQENCKKFD